MSSVGLPSTNTCQVYFNLWLQLTIFSMKKLFFLRVDFDSCIQRPCVTPCDTTHSIHDTEFYLKIMRLLSSLRLKKSQSTPVTRNPRKFSEPTDKKFSNSSTTYKMTLQKLKALYDIRALKFWNTDGMKVQEVSRVCNYQHKHVKTTKKDKKKS